MNPNQLLFIGIRACIATSQMLSYIHQNFKPESEVASKFSYFKIKNLADSIERVSRKLHRNSVQGCKRRSDMAERRKLNDLSSDHNLEAE